MSSTTQPVFLLGSGRSGTYAIAKLLEGLPGLEVHHEYLFESVLGPAVQHRMGLMPREQILDLLRETFESAIHLSPARRWIDCSNALPWIIGPLHETFPDAHFIHLVRDGRKVVSSFYHKFPDVMYADHSVAALQAWIRDPEGHRKPPPEKKYWRPVPRPGEPFFDDFEVFDRFERNCYYWQDVVGVSVDALEAIPADQQAFFKLEEVVSDAGELARLLSAMGVPYQERFFETLQRPINVATPRNFALDTEQRAQFDLICGPTMALLGYDSAVEYDVRY